MEYGDTTILIIDDNFNNIQVVMETLKPLECKMLYATSGQQGIERAENSNPDLILLDIMMPGMDGYTVCRKLKADTSLQSIPVIFLTAKADTEDIVKGFEIGGVDYVVKPFQAAELLARVKTHLTLKRSHDVLQLSSLSLEQANDAIYWTSEEGKILYANAMAHEMLDYPNGTLIDKPITMIDSEVPDLQAWHEWFSSSKGEGSTRSRIKHQKRGGALVDIEISTRFLSQNGINYAVSIVRDITEQIEFQKRLENWNEELTRCVDAELRDRKEAERLIRRIYDTVDIGIALIDEAGRYVQLNRRYAEIYGYAPETLLGASFLVVVPEEKHDVAMNEHRLYLQGGGRSSLERDVVRSDGDRRTVKIHSTRLKREDGKVMRIVVVDDITEQKRLETKHRESQQLLLQQSKMAAMGEMLSMIAHQWRQPLNVISATTIRLSLKRNIGKLTDEEFETALKQIQTYTQKMSETIDDFSQFCRPNQSKKPFTLTKLFEEISSLVSAQLKYHNIEMETVIKGDRKIVGHFNELSHVLINLVTNAKDALDELDIAEKRIMLEGDISSEEVTILCCNNGGEIPPEVSERIFEPYFTTKPEGKGTGIGLYMSKTIIEHHFNGEIDIENRDGGVCFLLRFPVVTVEES